MAQLPHCPDPFRGVEFLPKPEAHLPLCEQRARCPFEDFGLLRSVYPTVYHLGQLPVGYPFVEQLSCDHSQYALEFRHGISLPAVCGVRQKR